MSVVAGEDIVNLRLKERLERIDAEIKGKIYSREETRNLALEASVRFRRVLMSFGR